MTEVIATRTFQFKLTASENVREIASQLDRNLSRSLNRNICEASAVVDPKNPMAIIVEMKCATGADIYEVDKDTILRIIKDSERDKIEHVTGPLEIQV